MPPVIGAAIGIVAGGLAKIAVGVVISTAVSAITNSLIGKPKKASSTPPSLRERLVSTPTSNSPRQIVYGETRTAGRRVFMESTNNNTYLHIVQILASHEIDSVQNIYIDENLVSLDGGGFVSGGTFNGKIRFLFNLGTWNQSANSTLVSEAPSITSNHKFSGMAYAYIRLEFDAAVFPNGVPEFSFDVRGRKVYDWREASHDIDDPSTWAWTRNAALCQADWLRGVPVPISSSSVVPLLRGEVPGDEINSSSVISAANISDEAVSLNGGGSVSRYTVDGVLDTDVGQFEGLENLLTASNGFIVFTGGEYSINAAAAKTPRTRPITEDDLRGPSRFRAKRNREDLFNSVQGEYIGPSTAWRPGDFPSYEDTDSIDQDNGEKLWADFQYLFTTNAATAQRLARISLAENRQQKSMFLPCSLVALDYKVGDWIYYTDERRGYENKLFMITEWELVTEEAEDEIVQGVDLSLIEINSSIYAWAEDESSVIDPQNSNLPNALVIPAPQSLVAGLERWTSEGIVVLEATPASETTPVGYEFQYKQQGVSSWTTLPRVSEPVTTARINAVGPYDFRVRAFEDGGPAVSAWVTTSSRIDPENNLPRIVGLELTDGGHSVQFTGRDAQFSWRDTRRLDTAGYDVDQNLDGSRRDDDFKHYLVTIYTSSGSVLRIDTVQEPRYVYSLDMNRRDSFSLGLSTAQRVLRIGVRFVSSHNRGAQALLQVSNPAPEEVGSVTVSTSSKSIFVPFPMDNLDADHAGFILKGSQTSGFDPNEAGNILFQGNSHARPQVATGDWYVRYAAYDEFGQTGLNWSSEISVNVGTDFDPSVLDDIESDIATLEDGFDTVSSQWGVSVTTDATTGERVVAGILITGDPETNQGRMTFLADTFALASSDDDGDVSTPFVVDEGVVYIDEAVIRNLSGDNMSVETLSSITANVGTITAGILKSDDDKMVINLNDKSILITV